MMAASAVVAVVSAELLSSALARRSPSRVVPAGALVSAACLLALWPVASAAPRAAAVLVYLHVAAFGAALVSGFWSLVNERFDPYTARRVVGRIGTGATAGGVAGGAIGWGAALLLPVPAILVVLALLHAAAALVLLRLRPGGGERRPRRGTPNAAFAFQVLARTPYLQRIAVVVGLGAIVEGIVDWAFKAEVQKQFGGLGGGGLLAPLSLFYTGMAVASLLLQSDARPGRARAARHRGHRRRAARAHGRRLAARDAGPGPRHGRRRARRARGAHELAVPLRLRAALHAGAGGGQAPQQGRDRPRARQGRGARGERPDPGRAGAGAAAGRARAVRARGVPLARRRGALAAGCTAATSAPSSGAWSRARSASTRATSSTAPRSAPSRTRARSSAAGCSPTSSATAAAWDERRPPARSTRRRPRHPPLAAAARCLPARGPRACCSRASATRSAASSPPTPTRRPCWWALSCRSWPGTTATATSSRRSGGRRRA